LNTTKEILLVTETPPGTPNGFGVTLDTLFKDLDPDVLFTDAEFKDHGNQNGYQLAQIPFHRSKKYLLSLLIGKTPEWRGIFSRLWVSKHIKKKYDFIYSFVYSSSCLKYGNWLAKRFNSEHIVHIADHSPEFFDDKECIRIIKSAKKRITIGNNMRDSYQDFYKLDDFKVLHNGVDSNKIPVDFDSRGEFGAKNPFKLLFLGSLFENLHTECIEDVCEAVKQLSSNGHHIKFDIYGQIVPDNMLNHYIDNQSVRYNGCIPSSERFSLMEKYDCLIVPSSFNREKSHSYSYSIPTKLPEVLSSGLPVLIYGPKIMEAHRFCTRLDAGDKISERSIDALREYFIRTMENYNEIRRNSGKLAIKIKEDFSGNSVRTKLVHILGQ
tara:strand:+ start:141 stop:1286 length:1146 start_codon:yes stop_codon:yes gene_type:complete